MDKPKKIKTDSMYGEFGREKYIVLPRQHGRRIVIENIIKMGCIKQSLGEDKSCK